jgi:Tol biopolymer transport system component
LPDSAHFFAIAELPQQPATLWNISVAGDQQHKIAEGSNPWGISPDGSMLAITRKNDHEIWLVDPDGGNPRKVYDGGDKAHFRAIQFSPDGHRLAYIRSVWVNGATDLQIESRDLNGQSPISMLSGPAALEISQVEEGLRDMIWLPDNRLIYVGGEPYIHGMSCNLWQGQVDRQTGKFTAAPERLTNWAGFCVNTLSHTADGKKLAFNQSYDLEVVYAADFDSAKMQLSVPRRLTFTDDLSSPTGWTPDGSAVLIRSNREGTWGIYKQPLGGGPSESIISKLKNVSWSTPVSPDGKWLIYFQYDSSDPSQPIRIMRVPLSGGPSQEIVKVQSGTVRCPRITSATCVLAEISPDHNQMLFSAFDPITGRGHELKRFANDHADELGWDLSPDGTKVVAFRDTDSQFHIIPLHLTGRDRILQTQNGINLKNLLWAADGKGFFASAPTQRGAEFVYVNLQGRSKHLWELSGYNMFIAGRASPNGRHLAIQGSAGNSNVWMIENF